MANNNNDNNDNEKRGKESKERARTDEEEEIVDEVVLAHERGRQTHLALCDYGDGDGEQPEARRFQKSSAGSGRNSRFGHRPCCA